MENFGVGEDESLAISVHFELAVSRREKAFVVVFGVVVDICKGSSKRITEASAGRRNEDEARITRVVVVLNLIIIIETPVGNQVFGDDHVPKGVGGSLGFKALRSQSVGRH